MNKPTNPVTATLGHDRLRFLFVPDERCDIKGLAPQGDQLKCLSLKFCDHVLHKNNVLQSKEDPTIAILLRAVLNELSLLLLLWVHKKMSDIELNE